MIRRGAVRTRRPRVSPRPRRTGRYGQPWAMWPFHYDHGVGVQTIRDVGGRGHHITTGNAAANYWERHEAAGGWSVDLGSNASIAPGEVTMSQTLAPPITVMMVAQFPSANGSVISHSDSTTNHGWRIQRSGSNLQWTMGNVASLTGANTFSADQWFVAVAGAYRDGATHFLGSRNLTTLGVSVFVTGTIAAMSGTPTALRLGCRTTTAADFWGNQIALAVIWRRALTEGDVRYLLFHPWVVFEPSAPRLFFDGAGAAATPTDGIFYRR